FKTCCFKDYYPQDYFMDLDVKSSNFIKLKSRLKETMTILIEDFSVTHFISGMEFGLEQLSAEFVLDLKTKFPSITLEGAIPYENQVINWTESQRDKYYSIMQKIDNEVLLQYHYSYDCMRKRNLYMMNKSKFIILYTNNTNKIDNINEYAKSIGKFVINMDIETSNIIPRIKIFR
ncbi:MAG: SLOG family protein, partial [Tissierellia bacterium]|nr:SLOG family protein [Tissierellia bacterium]